MAAPHPPGGGSPLRVGGFVLLGVAAVAAVAGLVSLAGGGTPASQNSAAPPSAVKPAPAPSKPAPAGPPLVPGAPRPPASAAPAPSHSAPPPPAPPATPAPAAPSPAPAPHSPGTAQSLPGAGLPPVDDSVPHSGGGKGVGVPAVKAPVRVYNNSLIKNLAESAADQFRDSGWTVTSVGNYPFGNIPTSTVYYQAGEDRQRQAAEYLASSFGMRAEARFSGLRDASPGLIVIVTKDFQRR